MIIPSNKKPSGGNQTAEVKSQSDAATNPAKTQAPRSFLEAALDFLEMEAAVFPVQERGKTPKTPHGFKDASRDPEQVRAWWQAWPSANIGIPTGAVSGFWVLDIDGEEGEASLKRLESQNGLLPQTVEVITGGGGRHLWFSLPESGSIPNSVRSLGAGLDVRGDGGYVVAPPSLHASGRRYEWSVDSAEDFAPAPVWLLALVISPQKAKSERSPVDWPPLLQGVSEGGRNDALARLAGKLLGHRLDPYIALYLLAAWNDARCKPPLPPEEVYRTFCSVAGMEAKKRGVM